MDSPPPAPWAYAARAAYFGDRVCPFCDHHNPAGAKFCNDCGSPLHLKPCNQCDAVNHQAATNCYKCGAECPALFTTPEATPVLPAADPTAAWATPGDVGVAATVTQPPFAAGALRAEWRLAAIATMLIAGVYAAYRINAATPDAMEVASQPVGAGEHSAPTAASAVPMAVESKPVEPETTAALQAPIPTTNPEAPKRASTRQRPVPVPATKRASARQRPVPELQASVGATPPVAPTLAAAHVGAPVAETRKARQPDPWQAMHVSLARCGGDLIDRIVCDQRVRRRFCEGHWGEAPECASFVANDHGQ
jgi:ribosomal protein L40E